MQTLFTIRTLVAVATEKARLSGYCYSVYEAQRLTNPELFTY